VYHGRVERAGVEEPDPELGDRGGDRRRRQLDGHAPRLEQVGGTAGARGSAVAVLGDAHAGGCGDHGGHRGDVEGPGAVTTGPTRVEQRALEVDGDGGVDHRAHEPGDLGVRFALGAQRDEEPGDLGRLGLPRHDGAQHPAGAFLVEVLTAEQGREDVRPDDGGWGHGHGRPRVSVRRAR
jgi:hypothetical protein